MHSVNVQITFIHFTDGLVFGNIAAQDEFYLQPMPAVTTSASPEPTSSEAEIPAHTRRMCMTALMSSAILAALDTTIANTALPRIAVDLGASEAAIIWIANAYQIAMIATLLPFAALGESIGYRKVYVAGLVIFAAASALCGAASALSALIAGRVLQGIGAAAIMSVIAAFIRHIYPPRMLGRGLGTHALIVAIGFTLGPVVASAVLTVASWHWLFLINVPVAILSIALSVRYLPDVSGGQHRFEAMPAALCTAVLGLFTLGLCSVENGGGVALALVSVALAGLCLLALLRVQRGHPAPMLPIDLLKVRTIRLSSLTSICAFVTQSLALVSLPFLFQGAMGFSVIRTGLLLAAWPLVVALMTVGVAPLSDRHSSGVLCSAGLLVLAAGMLTLAAMPQDAAATSVALRLAICGIGFGLFQAPNMREIMSKASATRGGGASAVVAISRLLGQTCGAALVAQCFHWWHVAGPVMALWLGAGCALLGCIFSAMRLQTDRSAHVAGA
jgi:DHA2 family multidrug resistance protein-like MFS transporter